jgi:2-iminobutanoate/2-iminopropanoate deaminase
MPVIFLLVELEKKIIRPSDLYDPTPNAYSHAVRVEDTVYLAGQMAIGEGMRIVGAGDIGTQTRQVFSNIERILKAAGGGLNDIVSMSVFLKDMRDLKEFVRARWEIFEHDFPASTAVQVAGFADPEALVEIAAVAVVGSGRQKRGRRPQRQLTLKSD